MPGPTPKGNARPQIDAQLALCGRAVRSKDQVYLQRATRLRQIHPPNRQKAFTGQPA